MAKYPRVVFVRLVHKNETHDCYACAEAATHHVGVEVNSCPEDDILKYVCGEHRWVVSWITDALRETDSWQAER